MVDWNRPVETIAALTSLAAMSMAPDRLICVENGCDQDSAARVAAEAPLGTEILRLQSNRGFTGGANAGIDLAVQGGADWVLLVNNDATVDPECLSSCLEEAQLYPGTAVLGPAVVYAHDPATIWYGGGLMGRHTLYTRHRALNLPVSLIPPSGVTDFVPGCCALLSTAAWRELGPFRADLFAYFEDAEWALRARSAGWLCRYLGLVLCRHAVGASTGASGSLRLNATTAYYLGRNPFRVALETNGLALRAARLSSLGTVWNAYNAYRITRSWRLDVATGYLAGIVDAVRGRMGRRDEMRCAP